MSETQNPLEKFPPLKLKEVLEDGSEVTRTHYHVLCGCVPDEFKNYAEKVLNETPENIAKGMPRLKEFLEKEKKPALDENTLRVILRNSKYDLKKVEGKVISYLKTREIIGERLAQMDERLMETFLDEDLFGILPYRDKEGRAIIFHKMNLNVERYDIVDSAFLFFTMLMYMLEFPMTSLTGIVHLAEWRPPPVPVIIAMIKSSRMFTKLWLSLPIRIKGIEGVNESPPIRWIVNMLRPIMPAKIFSRIVFYGQDLEKLHASYPRDILPAEFGGKMGPINTAFYREEFANFVKRLAAEHRAKANNETIA